MKTIPSLFLFTVAAFINMVSQVDSFWIKPEQKTVKMYWPWEMVDSMRDVPSLHHNSGLPSPSSHVPAERRSTKDFYNNLLGQLSRHEPVIQVQEPVYEYEPFEPSFEDFGFMKSVPSFSSPLGDDKYDDAVGDDGDDEDNIVHSNNRDDGVISSQDQLLIASMMNGGIVKRHH